MDPDSRIRSVFSTYSQVYPPGDAHSFAVLACSNNTVHSLTPGMPPFRVGIDPLHRDSLSSVLTLTEKTLDSAMLASAFEQSFAQPRVLSNSFAKFGLSGSDVVHDPESSGIDFAALEMFYTELAKRSILRPAVLELAVSNLQRYGSSLTPEQLLRSVLLLLLSPLALHPISHKSFLAPLLKLLGGPIKASPRLRVQFLLWIGCLSRQRFYHCVCVLQQFISSLWLTKGSLSEDLKLGIQALSLFNKASSDPMACESIRLGLSAFYNDAINEMDFEDLFVQYGRWTNSTFSVLKYPFLLDPALKSRVIQIESAKMQRDFAQQAFVRQALFAELTFPVFLLQVQRQRIVSSTLHELSHADPSELKKPLKVKFVGEEGVDEGGVRKEFFQIIVRELFDPSYGMFVYDEVRRVFWFNKHALEAVSEFRLIGTILGLALYNSIILDVHFPPVMYKKLLAETPTLDDLAEFDPIMYRSLQQLLSYDGDDFEDVFMNDFTVTENVFGEQRVVELKSGGASIRLTKANREEYVDLYVRYALTDSVAQQFNAFRDGFLLVAGGRGLSLVRPEELELLLCGSPELDFSALEKVTRYEDGLTAESRVVRDFWSIVHRMSDADKKRLLFFVTGSDRVPIKGLGNLLFVISRNGPDSDRLPTAHTCFNHLLLPEYASKEKLERMLYTALKNAEGFGLM